MTELFRPSDAPVDTLVVVGTGHAASALVASLNQHRYQGRVVLVGDEKHPPYNRPPLSKKFLSEDVQPQELYFRSEDQLAKNDVEVRLGVAAVELNPLAHTLKLGSGDVLSYDKLVLATGAGPRGLPKSVDETEGNLNVLRNIADAVRLKAELARAQSIAIIGERGPGSGRVLRAPGQEGDGNRGCPSRAGSCGGS